MARRLKIELPSGIHDILGEDFKYYQKIENVAQEILEFYGFSRIETPIFEKTDLFIKSIGKATEIVKKQMYSFQTKGGDFLTLRPEATAPLARAYITQGMASWPQPVKLWTFGPFYRYERPQAGRYRQFYQLDIEIFGSFSPIIDAQVIKIFLEILRSLKIKKVKVKINSVGDSQCRPYYKKLLVSFFKGQKRALCQDCKRRLRENPLRILDCKEEKCQRIVKNAPQLVDHLCKECKRHLTQFLEILDELEIPYLLSPYLVRGLDYYTKTVFEIFFDQEKNALVGGGRYDNLIKILGGKETGAFGGAMGIERVVEIVKKENLKILRKKRKPKIFLAQLGDLAKRRALKLLEEFRKSKIELYEALGRDSLKSQLKLANKLKVKYTLILGQKEALENEIILRDMETGKQKVFKIDKIIKELKKRL